MCKWLIWLGLPIGVFALMEVQGHRGMRGLYPENTLPAFQAAIEAGVPVLELDLQVTRDGELVIYHDYCIDQDLIRDLTLAEVKQYDVGSHPDPEFPSQRAIPGTRIPTLQELFDLLKTNPQAKSVRLNLEMKRDPRHPEWSLGPKEFVKKLLAQVEQSRLSTRVYYSSFDPDLLAAMRALNAKAELGLIFDIAEITQFFGLSDEKSTERLLQIAQSLHAVILSPNHSFLTNAAQVASLQQKGFRIIPWTVNSPDQWDELMKMGVDGIITDYPQQLLEFLDEL